MRIKHLVLANGACSLWFNQSQSTNELMMSKIIFIASGPAKINLIYIICSAHKHWNSEIQTIQSSFWTILPNLPFWVLCSEIYIIYSLSNKTIPKVRALYTTALQSRVKFHELFSIWICQHHPPPAQMESLSWCHSWFYCTSGLTGMPDHIKYQSVTSDFDPPVTKDQLPSQTLHHCAKSDTDNYSFHPHMAG